MAPRVYLDWNATTPLRAEARAAMIAAMDVVGNPSSVHAEGRAARAAVEQARGQVARLLGVDAGQVTFTSGGTEGAATLLQPAHANDVLFVNATEHACVLNSSGYPASRRHVIGVSAHGAFDLKGLYDAVDSGGLSPSDVTVALHIANNETGVIEASETFEAIARHGFTVIADAVQAVGRMSLANYLPHVDALFISAHKIGGPKGVGAIVRRAGVCADVRPLIAGGGQEKGLRGGTENVAGIVGFGAAAEVMAQASGEWTATAALRDAFEAGLLALAPDAVVFAAQVARLPNTCLFAVPGLRAETALIAFDLDGVAVSSGSACSSGKVGKSHVLKAMGVADDLAASALRISFGDRSGMADVERCLASVERQVARLRRSAA